MMKQKGLYRQWFLWLAWIAAIYHIFMPFTPVIASVYITPSHHHEMMHMTHHDMSSVPVMSMNEGHSHSMGADCPNCLLGIHFYVQEQFFIPKPFAVLNTLLIAVVVFKDAALSPWNVISPTSRDPPQ